METHLIPDPRRRRGWTAHEDHMAIIIFAVYPFRQIRQALRLLPDRSPGEIRSRFCQVMADPGLQERVIAATGGDVFMHTTIEWEPAELLALAALLHDSHFANPVDAFKRYPHLFHPTRTAAQFLSAARRIGAFAPGALEAQTARYLEWAEEVRARADGRDAPAPPAPRPVYPPQSRFGQRAARLVDKAETLEDMNERVRAKFEPKYLAALVGRLGIEMLGKTKVTLGRATPGARPDIDLGRYRVQAIARKHCMISLRSDRRFYLEVFGRDIVVNGYLFYTGQIIQLKDRCLIDICGLPFLFFENPQYQLQ
jgi:hypothetical protein